ALTAAVAGVYVLVAGVLGVLLQARGSLVLSLLGVGLVAIVAQPVRDRLQRAVNRLMYGERDDPYAVLSRLGQRLEGTLAPEAVLPIIVETVAQTLKLPYVAIALAMTPDSASPDEAFPIVAAYGSPTADPLRLPLVYQAETVGALIVGPRAGETFSPADRRLLDDLARQAGVAAHAVRLTADLQRSRERLVTTREEERRRLRRDLHDGLGSQLAALHLRADTLRTMIPHDPAAAEAVVVELRDEIRAAIADIRRLVYELRPPALDELGLAGALRSLAAQYTSADGLRVVIDAPEPLPPLPAAVEVAAYRIAQEALTNVVRHARARTCMIRLTLAEDLRLEIKDDGIGLPSQPHAGVGLRSMRERAAELGGTCAAETALDGGAQVLVRLPLPPTKE
ncbi:MAG: Two component signal transduction histidine kinase, partial [Anaerolineales bacterium]|nr:Two component signal transduction histidine kinase [Anaerolineales bacterium]